MAGERRRAAIKARLATDGQVSVSALSKQLGVTEETIRRDLERLEAESFLTRVYGGAILNTKQWQLNAPFHTRQALHLEEKRKIAANVLPLLEGMNVIALDSSSTAFTAARVLGARRGVVLLSNSVAMLRSLSGLHATVVSTGGQFDAGTLSFTGKAAQESLFRYRADAMLFSCKGIDDTGEVFDSRDKEIEIKRMMFQRANTLILLADHTKFSRSSFVHLVDLGHVNYLVTDRAPSQEWIHRCAELGITLVY